MNATVGHVFRFAPQLPIYDQPLSGRSLGIWACMLYHCWRGVTGPYPFPQVTPVYLRPLQPRLRFSKFPKEPAVVSPSQRSPDRIRPVKVFSFSKIIDAVVRYAVLVGWLASLVGLFRPLASI